MSTNQQKLLTNIRKNRIKRRRFLMLLSILSIFIFTGVVWELRMEGISLTDDVRCEIESHEHVMACYRYDTICEVDMQENPEHEHSDDCYTMTLICGKEYHKHTEACYYTYDEVEDGQKEISEPVESYEEPAEDESTSAVEESTEEFDESDLVEESELPDEDEFDDEEFDDEEFDEDEDPYNGLTEEEWLQMMEQYGVSLLINSPQNPAKEKRNGELGKLYVVTELGEREKDRVNEYLSGIGLPAANEYGCISNTETRPYYMHVGDTVWLRVYGAPNAVDDSNNRYYLWNSGTNNIVQGVQEYCHEGETNGLRYVEREYKAVAVGDTVISYNEFAGSEIGVIDFYIRVEEDHYRGDYDHYYDHADIEVSDGGNYTITETGVYMNGETVETSTEYDTIIVSVNRCEIYDGTGKVTAVFLPDDYEAHGVPGSTQYELTSKYRCIGTSSKWFWDSEAKSAEFDTRVLLRPRKRTIKYSDGRTETVDLTGQPDTLIPSAIFSPQYLNISSVVDANNKCPNHSGLDFTVQDKLNYYFDIDPVGIEFNVNKRIENGTLSAGQCEFELYYVDDYMATPTEVLVSRVSNDADGKVDFGKQYFLQERDEPYHYIIREVIPAGAIRVNDTLYYYNGVLYSEQAKDVYVKVTRNGATLYAVADKTDFSFVNDAVPPRDDEQYTNLKVIKNWSDISTNQHLGDSVYFQVWRSVNGVMESYPFTIYGSTSFELNDYNHWTCQFNGLPLKLDGNEYTYIVQEVSSFNGYTTGYNLSTDENGNIIAVIENRANEPTSITIKKEWLDYKGNLMESPPGTSISGTLYRDYKIVPVPIQINIVDPEGNYKGTIESSGYIGQDAQIMFKVQDGDGWMQNRAVLNYSGCDSLTWDAHDGQEEYFTVHNIQGPVTATVTCNNYLGDYASNIILRYSFSNSLYPIGKSNYAWRGNGVTLGTTTYVYYSHHGLKENAYSAINAENRTAAYQGMELPLTDLLNDGVLKNNTTYTISFYTYWRNLSTELNNTVTNMHIKLSMYYKDGNGNHYSTIMSDENVARETWTHLQKTDFELKLPEGATDCRLYLETEETNSYCVLYLDEFIIAKAGTNIQVDRNNENVGSVRRNNPTYVVDTSKTFSTIPGNADVWYSDAGWNKSFTLDSSNNWTLTFKAPDQLNEESGKQYRYYAVENPISGYTTSYLNNKVAFNTEKNPITIQNRAIAYSLPATGGGGTARIRLLGLITLLCTGIAGVYIKKRKRRSSA